MDITRANIPEAILRLDPETSMFMDQIALWCGPSTTLAVMPVRQGTRDPHSFISVNVLSALLGDV